MWVLAGLMEYSVVYDAGNASLAILRIFWVGEMMEVFGSGFGSQGISEKGALKFKGSTTGVSTHLSPSYR